MSERAKYLVSYKDQEFELLSAENEGSINGEPYTLDLVGDAENGFHLIEKDRSYRIQIEKADYREKMFRLQINGKPYEFVAADRFDLLLKKLGMEHLGASVVNDLKAPMPGLVLDIRVTEGESVSKGQALLVLEAMKMENVLKAESDATIKAIHCEKGAAVEKNQVLIEFDT